MRDETVGVRRANHPYRGVGVACPKCDSTGTDDEYKPGGVYRSPLTGGGYRQEQYLRRTCQNCGHAWRERTADADPTLQDPSGQEDDRGE